MARVLGVEVGSMQAVSVAADSGTLCERIGVDGPAIHTPLVVYFGADGGTLAGAEAVERASADPARGVVGVRRWLSDPRWQFPVDGVQFGAADVATLLFGAVASEVGEIGAAVLSVPAYAHSEHRATLRDAACAAGLPVVQLLNEPTAAAAAYAWTAGVTGTVLVVGLDEDFDATVLRVASPTQIELLAADGELAGSGGISSKAARRSVERVLRTAGVRASGLDALVLHGEGAKDQAAVGFVSGLVGRAPAEGIDPAEVIARGAAMHAASLAAQDRAAA